MAKTAPKTSKAKAQTTKAKPAKAVAKKVAPLKAVKATKPAKKVVKAVKKTSVTKAKADVKLVKLPTIKEPFNKTQLFETISEMTGVAKKDISSVFNSIIEIIGGHVTPKGPGEFTLPGVLKVVVIDKPAVKERKGINPFTKEPTIFKAKPARKVIKVRPLKKLKDAANKK